MELHRMILEGGPRDAEWLLEWDDATLALKDPDGHPVFEVESNSAHRVVGLYQLFAEGQISFATPVGFLTFKKHRAALTPMRRLVELGLARDAEFRSELRRESLRAIPRGLALFVVGGGLFSLYCWYASWAPDLPSGHWIRWFGWLIHGVLLVLMGAALAGPCVCYFGFRQWLSVRRIERRATSAQESA
jgi:hypothetical protein